MKRNNFYDKIIIGNTVINPGFIEYYQMDKKTKTILIHLTSGNEFLFNIIDCKELFDAFSLEVVYGKDGPILV